LILTWRRVFYYFVDPDELEFCSFRKFSFSIRKGLFERFQLLPSPFFSKEFFLKPSEVFQSDIHFSSGFKVQPFKNKL